MRINERHDAKYFFDLLCKVYYNLHDGYFQSKKHYYRSDCANGYITVHHAEERENEEPGTYYHIQRDGTVLVENSYHYKSKVISLDDLDGDDFELFSRINIYKSGYVVLNPAEDKDNRKYAKRVISSLHGYIASLEPDYWKRYSEEERTYPVLCGGSSWSNGLTEEFSYYAVNGLEVHIQTIPVFCRENDNRKYFGLIPIPFIKNLNNDIAFHVTFVDFDRQEVDKASRLKQCNDAVKELMGYISNVLLPTLEYDFDTFDFKKVPVQNPKWINTQMEQPLFDN